MAGPWPAVLDSIAVVAGIALLALYGPKKPVGIDISFTVAGIVTLLEETKPGMHLVSL